MSATASPPTPPTQTADIRTLVHGFYAEARQDPLLGPVFERALKDRWDAHLARMVDFWSTVLLGSKSFRGDVFKKHMALRGLTPAHFAAWTRLWQQHTARCLPPALAEQAQRAAHGIACQLYTGYFDERPAFAPPPHSHGGDEAAHSMH